MADKLELLEYVQLLKNCFGDVRATYDSTRKEWHVRIPRIGFTTCSEREDDPNEHHGIADDLESAAVKASAARGATRGK
ncbi:MAG TPA: hypothetical protein VM103_01685 [Candidatus Paceibacterota bacterium]|nr:hypothetical protein [Candidatus Paceibacterota bacterium]